MLWKTNNMDKVDEMVREYYRNKNIREALKADL